MEKDKKLGLFNWGAAILGVIWSFKNKCQMEYFTMFALFVIAIPLFLYIAGFFLIIIFGPSANLGSLVVAMMWGYYALKLFLVGLLVFSIFVGFKANKWVKKNATKRNEDIGTVIKRNDKWNKAGIIVFIVLCVLLEGLHIVVVSMKKHDKQVRENVQEEQKEQNCQILLDTYRTVYSKYGNSFSNDKFIKILTTNQAVFVPANGNEHSPVISARINDISSDFKLRQMGQCDITQENCYIYVNDSACQFFFDSNGKVELSNYTKEHYKNLK